MGDDVARGKRSHTHTHAHTHARTHAYHSIWRATRRLCRYSPACMKAHKELIEKHCMEREGLAMQDQKLALYGSAGVRTCKCPRSVAEILGDWEEVGWN